MTDSEKLKPWDQVRDLLHEDKSEVLVDYLDQLSTDDTIRTLFRLSPDEQSRLMELLPPEHAADLIDDVPEAHAAGILDEMKPKIAASIFAEMDSNQAANVLREMDKEDIEEILQNMDDDDAADARQLIRYTDDCAGGLMMKEFLAYRGTSRVSEVIEDLSTRDEDIPLHNLQEIFIVRPSGKLRGSVSLADIAFTDPSRQLGPIAKEILSVNAHAGLDELLDFFEEHDPTIVPVVDDHNRLIGLLRRRAVYDEIANRADDDALKRQGIVGGDELRSLPVLTRSRRRLSWLSVNIGLNIVAASVIAAFQDTLQAAIALAVFLPIVSDMSGCSGNQAVAVSMRELTLGILRPVDVLRVWAQEASVGVINGIALGCLLAIAAWLWQGNAWLGLVVGAALALNTVIAVSIGGTVPLLLKRMNVDPALASGPVLTTITDMCGFFLVLSLATLVLPKIAT